jgi:hypothetical protein
MNCLRTTIWKIVQSLPYPNSLKFLLTPITCKSQKFKKKSQLPSFFSHTICDLTIHVCLSLSLKCIVSLGNTKSKFLFVVTQELHKLRCSSNRPTTIKVFILQPHQPPWKKAIVGTRKALGYFLNTRRIPIYKVKFPSERDWMEFRFFIGHFMESSSFHLAFHLFVGTSLCNFIGWLVGRALCPVTPLEVISHLGGGLFRELLAPWELSFNPTGNKIRAAA